MKLNLLHRIFDAFNREGIHYCIRSRYSHLPEKLDGGDVDLLVKASDFSKVKSILHSHQFVFYPFTEPNFFYYYFDKDLGLIQLDFLLTRRMPKLKKFKNFFILADGGSIGNQKTFLRKIQTGIRRRLHHFMEGKVICFVGPDGSGKSTLSKKVYESLRKFPIQKKLMHFGTPKPSPLYRMYNRLLNLCVVHLRRIFGKMTLTDRYIYLTFRRSHWLFRKFLRWIAPTPDIVFVMKADYATLKRRKFGQKDCLAEPLVKELYTVFGNIHAPKVIEVDSEKPIDENVALVSNLILQEFM